MARLRRPVRALPAACSGSPTAAGAGATRCWCRASPSPTPRADRAAEEESELRERLTAAMDRLKASSGKKGGFLYEQPWYVIIGPPGSGKTTALANSGLDFPLSDGGKLQGVGGTRLCEWWLSDNAVLIDTAGRYTSQDSDASADKAGWERFLDLLKKSRPRLPLNGVLVTFGVDMISRLGPAGARAACAHRAPAHQGAGRQARPAPAGLFHDQQVGPAGRLHGILRRPRQDRARAGLGLHLPRRGRRRSRRGIEVHRGIPAAAGPPAGPRDRTPAAGTRAAAARRAGRLPGAVRLAGGAARRPSSRRPSPARGSIPRRCCAACTSPPARRRAARSTGWPARCRAPSGSIRSARPR